MKHIIFKMPAAVTAVPITEEALADPQVAQIATDKARADFLKACASRALMRIADPHEFNFMVDDDD